MQAVFSLRSGGDERVTMQLTLATCFEVSICIVFVWFCAISTDVGIGATGVFCVTPAFAFQALGHMVLFCGELDCAGSLPNLDLLVDKGRAPCTILRVPDLKVDGLGVRHLAPFVIKVELASQLEVCAERMTHHPINHVLLCKL